MLMLLVVNCDFSVHFLKTNIPVLAYGMLALLGQFHIRIFKNGFNVYIK
jgi:hypothetical protein